jgi:hypothetical protein
MADMFGNPFTFVATGLPPGLWINPQTGLISGMVTAQQAGITAYDVTITATGGGDSDSYSFKWYVLGGTARIVLFAINNTLRHGDDITLLEPTPLPLSVRVTMYTPPWMGPQSVSLSIPSGRSTLDTTTLLLGNRQSATITMTPLQVSAQDDDVVLVAAVGGQQVGEGKAVNMEKIEITTGNNVNKIRAANTPAGMVDRVSVREAGKTAYSVVFAGPQVQKKMLIAIHGMAYVAYGSARLREIDAAGQVHLYGTTWTRTDMLPNNTYTGHIVGIDQTTPGQGNVGNLWVGVFRDGEEKDPAKALVKTTGFSVAAIPETVTMKFLQKMEASVDLINGKRFYRWGAMYKVEITSDSGNFRDLDKVKVCEIIVRQTGATGAVATLVQAGKVLVGKFESLSERKIEDKLVDRHAWAEAADNQPEAVLSASRFILKKGAGKGDLFQYVRFSDERTGVPADPAKAVVVPNSGFKIHLEVDPLTATTYAKIRVTKTPLQINDVGVRPGNMAAADQEEKVVEI